MCQFIIAFIYNKKHSITILHMYLFTKENILLKSRHKYVSSISKKIIQKLFDYIDVMIFSSQAKIFAYISSLINNYFKARWGRSVKKSVMESVWPVYIFITIENTLLHMCCFFIFQVKTLFYWKFPNRMFLCCVL